MLCNEQNGARTQLQPVNLNYYHQSLINIFNLKKTMPLVFGTRLTKLARYSFAFWF